LNLKKAGIICKVKGSTSFIFFDLKYKKCGTSALRWKDEREIYLLTNTHNPPSSSHSVEEEENASKPLYTESYNKEYVCWEFK
jgi:hypothetical protein